MNLLGATIWESLPGQEFNRLKFKANGWRGSHFVNTYLSHWSLNPFTSGFHKPLNFLTKVFGNFAWILGCQVKNLWYWSQRKFPNLTLGKELQGRLSERGGFWDD